MNSPFGSNSIGTRLTAAAITAVAVLISTTASGQTPPFSKDVLDILLASRTQKSASQASAQEISSAVDELSNIYVISSLPRAIELGDSPAIRAQLELQKRVLLFQAFANDFLARNAATEQEIFKIYEEQVALSPPKEFKARHILVDTQSAAIALTKDLQDGADFITLAKERSTGPSAPSGGDLGWFTAQSMVKPFSDAVAGLEDGAFTASPVQTSFGWHVIMREDSRDSSPPPLDSVHDVIKQRVEQQKFQEFMSGLRSKTAE